MRRRSKYETIVAKGGAGAAAGGAKRVPRTVVGRAGLVIVILIA